MLARCALFATATCRSRSYRLFSTPVLGPTHELPTCFVSLDGKRSKICKLGNSLVFSSGVVSVTGFPSMGDEVYVKDAHGTTFARGIYNPRSQYRVRVLAYSYEKHLFHAPMVDILYARVRAARRLRRTLALPDTNARHNVQKKCETNVYRLINGEGDALSGLIVDVLGGYIVVQSSAVWTERYRDLITNALMEDGEQQAQKCGNSQIIWRRMNSRLCQDGLMDEAWSEMGCMTDAELTDGAAGGPHGAGSLQKDRDAWTHVRENGINYVAYLYGQKTGFYCDQRDNRRWIGRNYCASKRVLDLYCYSGGFSLNALCGGASSVVAVDSSAVALQLLRENLAANNWLNAREKSNEAQGKEMICEEEDRGQGRSVDVEIIHEDVDTAMRALYKAGRRFDLVVCDPPKLAPARSGLNRAIRKYVAININAMKLVGGQEHCDTSKDNSDHGNSDDGGLLFTCTCSAAMTQSGRFVSDVLLPAAVAAHKRVSVLSVVGPATDHPIAMGFPEGSYFQGVLCWVAPM